MATLFTIVTHRRLFLTSVQLVCILIELINLSLSHSLCWLLLWHLCGLKQKFFRDVIFQLFLHFRWEKNCNQSKWNVSLGKFFEKKGYKSHITQFYRNDISQYTKRHSAPLKSSARSRWISRSLWYPPLPYSCPRSLLCYQFRLPTWWSRPTSRAVGKSDVL